MKKVFLMMLLATVFIVGCGKKANDGNVIKIGVIAPLTGNYAQYGVAVKEGVELKVDAINNAGGINGKKIELITADSKGDVQEAVNAFKKMVSQDKVNVVIGEVVSATSQAISGLAQQAKVPLISATATSLDVTKGKDFVFRTTFTDPYQGTATAKYAKSKGIKSIAILTNSSNDYSVGIANAFKAQAAKDGITITEEKYTNDDKDFKAILTKVKGQNPQAIFIPDYYNTIGLIISQAKDLGINAQYLGGDGWDGIQTNFGKVAEGAIFASQFAPDDKAENVQKFMKAYKAKYNKEPIMFAALGYDTVEIVETALKSTKDLSGASIREAMNNVSGIDLVTGKLKFDADRNPEKAVTFIQVKGGKLTGKILKVKEFKKIRNWKQKF